MAQSRLAPVWKLINNYIRTARAELNDRWNAWVSSLDELEKHEVIGGLLGRQVTLATQLAASPGTWNGHIAPIVLRAMADVHITLAWMFRDPLPRARLFVRHGLGQQKLHMAHLKSDFERRGIDPEPVIKPMEDYLSTQRFPFLTEVNLGSWSELNTRQMAEQVGEIDFYNMVYTPFSAATHSLWNHIELYNLTKCQSPLHRHHRIPIDLEISPEPDYLYRAAKFLEKSFKLFDSSFCVRITVPSAFEQLETGFESIGRDSTTAKRDAKASRRRPPKRPRAK